jgi:pSer/pThr/pTyr-binding forkhead associated (FHA) protein
VKPLEGLIMTTHVILTATEGNLKPGEFIFADQTRVVIGRSEACSLRLDDPTVSRRHCLIDVGGETAWLLDLDSLNGTLVNGEMVGNLPRGGRRLFRALHDGDELRIGNHSFRVGVATVDSHDPVPVEEYAPDLCGACI